VFERKIGENPRRRDDGRFEQQLQMLHRRERVRDQRRRQQCPDEPPARATAPHTAAPVSVLKNSTGTTAFFSTACLVQSSYTPRNKADNRLATIQFINFYFWQGGAAETTQSIPFIVAAGVSRLIISMFCMRLERTHRTPP
jgi:hypothetical protein